MKIFRGIVFLFVAVQLVRAQEETCEKANEIYSVCGNLCEDSCSNAGDACVYLPWVDLRADNEVCVPGCYCANGYIRTNDGLCVTSRPNTCGSAKNSRCAAVSKHSVYKRCISGLKPACYKRTFQVSVEGYYGGCTCVIGYSQNLKRQCIRNKSAECRNLKNTISFLSWLSPPNSC